MARFRAGMLAPKAVPPPPMMAVLAPVLPVGPQWTYEVKWDGYRTLAVKIGRDVRLFSRKTKDVTQQYPLVEEAVARLPAAYAILDGEIVAVDPQGRPSFQALHHRSSAVTALYAFDLLHLNDRDYLGEPLELRRRMLSALVSGSQVLLSEPLPGTPDQIERVLRSLQLEGVVAKRRDSRYEAGKRSRAWVKVKFARRQEFVVGGYTPTDRGFDALLVGYYSDEGALLFAGRVRSGFTPRTRADVFARLKRPVSQCPFVNLPTARKRHWGEGITKEAMPSVRWVRPAMVVDVSFTEWTRDGSLRHPAFVGVREDKASSEVRRES